MCYVFESYEDGEIKREGLGDKLHNVKDKYVVLEGRRLIQVVFMRRKHTSIGTNTPGRRLSTMNLLMLTFGDNKLEDILALNTSKENKQALCVDL